MTAVNERIKGFATSLLERHGALIDWPADAAGLAILPSAVAGLLRVPEEVRLASEAAPAAGVLGVNLATDFMERVEPLVERCPTATAVRLDGLYLKKSPMDEPVARFFSFPTARVRVASALPVRLEYHCWYFAAAVSSEDRWEDLIAVQVNSATGARVELPDPLGMMEAQPAPEALAGATPDLDRARITASLLAAGRVAPFLGRLEARLERDRRRIREYYGALLKESSPARSRGPADPEKIQEKRRAVEVELRRRLQELDQRYALRLRLDPLALVILNMPVLEVELEVSQRPAKGMVRAYWNPMRKELEPLACTRCAVNLVSVRFDNALRPVCAGCVDR